MGENVVAQKTTNKNPLVVRKNIQLLEKRMREVPGAMVGDCCPLNHSFAHGLYIRQIIMPAMMLFVTKIHKHSHAAFIMAGDVSVMEESGPRRIVAPDHFITMPGTKRIVFTHEDTVWVTVHATDKMDLQEIEEEIIAKSFEEIKNLDDYKDFVSEVTL